MTFNAGGGIDPGRASSGGGGRGGGRGRGVAVGGGLGGVVILVIALIAGVSPDQLTGGAQVGAGPVALPGAGVGADAAGSGEFDHCTTGEAANAYVDCRIIATAETLDAVWVRVLPDEVGVEYVPPDLVLFQDQVETGCGGATSEVGPFYCPPDQTTYFDTSFFQVLTDRFGSSGGPLAQEYVVAHEFGHHIQDQLGVLGQVQQDPAGEDSAGVRSELQADCLAGVWAHFATTTPDPDTGRPLLAPFTDQDLADALSAASAVGDDRIQAASTGQVDPEGWTHGSSEQRQRWFATGYREGTVASCDTFAAAQL